MHIMLAKSDSVFVVEDLKQKLYEILHAQSTMPGILQSEEK